MPALKLTGKQTAGKCADNFTREGPTMSKKWLWLTIAVVLVGCEGRTEFPEEVQGTTKEQLAELELPQPSEVSVALLPFWDYKNLQRHVQDCGEALTRRFGVEGFLLVPPARVAVAVLEDKELAPAEPMGREDAIRLGAALGAQWAVYGSILQLETYSDKPWWGGMFDTQKYAKAEIKLSVVDVVTGDIVFWQQRFDASGGTGTLIRVLTYGALGEKKATTLERRAVEICFERMLQDHWAALPEHERTEELGPHYTSLDKDEARAAYEADPRALDTAIVYGQALLSWQLFKEAEEVLGQGVRYHRDNADARFWHGLALYALGDLDGARARWERALRIDPTHKLAAERLQPLDKQQQAEQ